MPNLTSADIVNRAIVLISGFDNKGLVTGTPPNFDGSQIGIAAGAIYAGVIQTAGRQFGYDFSRNEVGLVVTGNTPPVQWTFEYAYPTNGVEVRQLTPAVISDPNNPLPVRWTVGNVLVASVPTKVVWTNLANAVAVFTNQPPENLWDGLFTESVVRLLASELAMGIEGRPDTSKNLLEESSGFEDLAEARDG